jgi:hypothetical protein
MIIMGHLILVENHLYYEVAQKDKGEIVIQEYYKVLDFSR